MTTMTPGRPLIQTVLEGQRRDPRGIAGVYQSSTRYGVWPGCAGNGGGDLTLTGGRLIGAHVWVERRLRVSGFSFRVGTAESAKVVDCGLYNVDYSSMLPSTLWGSVTGTSVATTGRKTALFGSAKVLLPGAYFLAWNTDATGTLLLNGWRGGTDMAFSNDPTSGYPTFLPYWTVSGIPALPGAPTGRSERSELVQMVALIAEPI